MSGQLIHQWGGLGVYPEVVVTPDGALPLASTSWSYTERWWTDRRTPGWAIVLGVVFGLTLVGLLFFMVTENHPCGSVTIHMRSTGGPGWDQTIQANNPSERAGVMSAVVRLDDWCATARHHSAVLIR